MGSLTPLSPRHHSPSQHPWVKWPLALVFATCVTLLMLLGLASFRPERAASAGKRPLSATLESPHEQARPRVAPPPSPPQAAATIPAAARASSRPQAVQRAAPIAPPPVQAAETGTTPAAVAPIAPAALAGPSAPMTLNAGTPAGSGSSPAGASGSAAGAHPGNAASSHAGGQGGASTAARSACEKTTDPAFPREAVIDDVARGEVVARLYPDASGKVVRVEILSAKPTSHARYFEREARRAVRDWRCTLAGQDEAVRQVFDFKLKD